MGLSVAAAAAFMLRSALNSNKRNIACTRIPTRDAASPPQARQPNYPLAHPLDPNKATIPTPMPTNAHENLPEVYNVNNAAHPEVYHQDQTASSDVAPSSAPEWAGEMIKVPGNDNHQLKQRSWRRFWLLAALALVLVIIVAAVASSPSRQGTVKMLPATALAAVSYKQADGVQKYRVYFQAQSGALCQAVWKSGTGRWETTPLKLRGAAEVEEGEPQVKLETPLSAHVSRTVEMNVYGYHDFFLDVQDCIQELVQTNLDEMLGFTSVARSAMRGNYMAASYGRQCVQECGNATSMIVWQSADEEIRLTGYEPACSQLMFTMNVTVGPPAVHDAAVWIVSLGPDEGLMSIYLNTGSLTRLYFNITDG